MNKPFRPLPPAPRHGLLQQASHAPYLKSIKMTSFGAFSQKTLGPFSPHLNVVFGKNEAGKSTIAAFVKGVLFGWEEARGARNTYRPEHAQRVGSLIFAEDPASASDADRTVQEWELSRARNSEGLKGEVSLVSDIDKETYVAMFSLSSDELQDLRSTDSMTAKLLTAGSGTQTSPTEALEVIQGRLGSLTSRASSATESLVRLGKELSELRAQTSQAAQEAERLRHLDEEFTQLEPERADILARIDAANEEIERLKTQRAALENIGQQLDKLHQQYEELAEEKKKLASERQVRLGAFDSSLPEVSASREGALRDFFDTWSEQQAKLEHSCDLAKENYSASYAKYEALHDGEAQLDVRKAQRQRSTQVFLSVLLPLIFVLVGVLTFLHGQEITSLSFTALGAGLVVFALFLAAAALVMLFRPNKEEELRASQESDARWVMLQDKKRLEACEAALADFTGDLRRQLDEVGLGAAEGSLRRARSLLEEARQMRTEQESFDQRRRALVSRISSVEAAIEEAQKKRRDIFAQAKLEYQEDGKALDAELARAGARRNALLETSERVNSRYGELKAKLEQAKGSHTLDELKLKQQQIITRQEESSYSYACLLLARRMLQSAINTWESKSQPEVYRQASRFLSLMTNGRWEKVELSGEGDIQVVDAAHTVRKPIYLSLGTRQQLYLALRIALLLQADNVGRAVPIFADDILVHFDAQRREGAARALAELSQSRQVVLFTCHEDVVEALRAADPKLTELSL